MRHFPTGHPLDTGEPTVSIAEIAKHPILLNSRGFLAASLFEEECEKSGTFPEVRYRSQNAQTLVALAVSGLGVAIFGDSVSLKGHNASSSIITNASGDPLSFSIGVAWHRQGAPAEVSAFGESLHAFLEESKTQN